MENLREKVQLDLERGKKLIEDISPSPIDPQFRLANETQEFLLSMTFSDHIFRPEISMVNQLMSAIKIKAYTCCAETIEPDGIFCYGQQIRGEKTEIYGLHETITRTPLGFSNRREFTQEELTGYEKEFPRFFGSAEVAITDSLQKELEEWFGAEGKFPLVAIDPKGKIKGFPSGWAQKLEICNS